MGLLDNLDSLELSDEVKARIRSEYEVDLAEKDNEIVLLRSKDRRSEVEQEVTDLAQMGFSDVPGLLKFVRRVFLSDDGEAGAILLSDSELDLSGDEATGSKKREEITVAGAVRTFISLLPKNDEGRIALSDQALAADAAEGAPETGDDETDADKADGASQRLSGITGIPVARTRKRYAGGRPVVNGGGS